MVDNAKSYEDIKKIVWSILSLLVDTKKYIDFNIIAFILFLKKENIVDKIIWRFESDPSISVSDAIKNSIDDFNNYIHGEIAEKLLNNFSRDISVIDKHLLIEIFNLLDEIDNDLYQLYSAELIDDIYLEIAQRTGRKADNIIQPKEITQLIDSLIELPPNAQVYNPFAGLASYGVGFRASCNYHGQEINQNIWSLGVIRLLAHHVKVDNYVCEDSFYNWQEGYKRTIFPSLKNQLLKFDLVVSTPPFGMPVSPLAKNESFKNARTAEDFILINGLESINPEGKFVMVASNNVLNAGGSRLDIRKNLVDNDNLELVISLPSGIFDSTSISTSILFFSKSKNDQGTVKFVNGESFFKQEKYRKIILVNELLELIHSQNASEFIKIVNNVEISANDYNLNPSRYLIKEFVIPNGFRAIELNELIISITRSSHNDYLGRLIHISNLAINPIDYETSFSEVASIELRNGNTNKLSTNALIVSRIHSRLKPTYFIYDGENPVYINSNLWAFSVRQNIIDIAYLINELYSDFFQKQLIAHSSSGVITSISLNEFLKIKILVPDKPKQKEIIVDARKKIILSKENELKELRDKFEQQTFEEFASLKHALGNPIPGINTSLEYIYKYIQDNEGKVISLDAVVSNRRKVTLRDKFNVAFEGLKLIRTLLKKGDNGLILEHYPLEGCKIIALMRAFCNSYHSDKFSIKVYDENKSIEDIEILANNDLIKILLNDILLNANNHAFKDYEIETNEVAIFLSILNDTFHLNIANNGLPFPTNFDHEKFIQKYQKTADSEGTGIGGYDINRIALYFGGNFHLITDGLMMEGYNSIYNFSFPILNAMDNEQ
jgi:type I restriction enzyme M protein